MENQCDHSLLCWKEKFSGLVALQPLGGASTANNATCKRDTSPLGMLFIYVALRQKLGEGLVSQEFW